MFILALLAGVAHASGPVASVGFGAEWLTDQGKLVDPGRLVRASIQWDVGPLELGPVVTSAVHSAWTAEEQAELGT